ncbi:MAG TPA: NAD(P)/FAD-dependent oxidoreductase [Candidatus Acidoferrales bacterium]|nr:NAD(P)/FAD-dependent oxidoreductase [Candidatus Acidoferrales bacterium]
MTEMVDVVVVGMGPGGEEVAGALAQAGLRVIGVERELVGGECPYWGCVPSKMMIRSGDLLAEGRRIPIMAGGSRVDPDWSMVARRIRAEATDEWDDKVAVDRFLRKGGEFVRGSARLVGGYRVVAGSREFEASRAIVLNVGTTSTIPPIPGLAGLRYWTNREAIAAQSLPTSLAVLGGGAIGVELAQAFARFNVGVTIIEAAPRLLATEEPEAGDLLADVLREEGIDVRLGTRAESVAAAGAGVAIRLSSGATLSVDRLLVSVGRHPNIDGLGLEEGGGSLEQGHIGVDNHMRAGERLWAVGDATGHGAFTHVSMYQARIAVADILGRPHAEADYHALPRVTFTDPEIGAAGLTEAQARASGIRVKTGVADQSKTARGWIHKAGNRGLIKLVEDVDRGHLVGATAMSPAGGEILGLLTLAVQARVPTGQLREMIYAYPTFHRGMEDALADLASS